MRGFRPSAPAFGRGGLPLKIGERLDEEERRDHGQKEVVDPEAFGDLIGVMERPLPYYVTSLTDEHIISDAWLALDESERMRSVERYHRRQRIRLPNETIHAVIHVIVENQVTLGDALPAKAVLFRLMKEGLDRHEALHAMGSVLSEKFFVVMSEQDAKGDLNADYVEKLESVTAESWRKQAQ
jgi:hypothetical protein